MPVSGLDKYVTVGIRQCHLICIWDKVVQVCSGPRIKQKDSRNLCFLFSVRERYLFNYTKSKTQMLPENLPFFFLSLSKKGMQWIYLKNKRFGVQVNLVKTRGTRVQEAAEKGRRDLDCSERILVWKRHKPVMVERPQLLFWTYIQTHPCSGMSRDSRFCGTFHLYERSISKQTKATSSSLSCTISNKQICF